MGEVEFCCSVCERVLMVKPSARRRKKYCEACRREVRATFAKKLKASRIAVFSCRTCGKQMIKEGSIRRSGRCDDCRSAGLRMLTCKQCKQAFVFGKTGWTNRMFCGEGCYELSRHRMCVDCGEPYVAVPHGKCKRCPLCKKRNRTLKSAIKRRARRAAREAAEDTITPGELWTRDGGRCQLCHKKIKWNKKWPHPLSMSVDHIVPLSRGGTDEASNLQSAHLSCNCSKNNAGGSQMRMF